MSLFCSPLHAVGHSVFADCFEDFFCASGWFVVFFFHSIKRTVLPHCFFTLTQTVLYSTASAAFHGGGAGKQCNGLLFLIFVFFFFLPLQGQSQCLRSLNIKNPNQPSHRVVHSHLCSCRKSSCCNPKGIYKPSYKQLLPYC